ncbi:hypothetical protein [Desulforegula conservatrix]|uniref:hypothetical protein n=1 Tax=Desulforegula conservatrix TaxID=153026 RepID=UPI0012EC6B63|nr:hypothetical protein [Desulforegula conservatrix]
MDNGLPVCMKCGYKAQSENDPLLTSFNGMGECPGCGAIPRKMSELKPIRLESDGITEPSMKKLAPEKGASVYQKIIMVILIQLLLVGLLYIVSKPAMITVSTSDIYIETDQHIKVVPDGVYNVWKNGKLVQMGIDGKTVLEMEKKLREGQMGFLAATLMAIIVVVGIVLSAKILQDLEEEHAEKARKLLKSRGFLNLLHAVAGLSFIIGAMMFLMMVFGLSATIDDPKAYVIRPIVVLFISEILSVFGLHYYRALKPFLVKEK